MPSNINLVKDNHKNSLKICPTSSPFNSSSKTCYNLYTTGTCISQDSNKIVSRIRLNKCSIGYNRELNCSIVCQGKEEPLNIALLIKREPTPPKE